jgi:glutamate-1-semialdehyde 2,1-aminomutase
MQEIVERLGIESKVLGIGSMATILFNKLDKVTNYREAIQSDQDFFMRYWFGCVTRGVMLMAPKWSEESFLTTAHTEKDIDETLNVINDSLKELIS